MPTGSQEHSPIEQYTQLKTEYAEQGLHLEALSRRLSWSRLVAFLLLAGIPYLLGRISVIAGISGFAVFLTIFIFLVRKHIMVLRKREHIARLEEINHGETEALNGDLARFDGGLRFDSPDHPYAHDIDVFGEESLFRILNRTVTTGGAETLAGWLKEPLPDPGAIIRRQEAVRELIPGLRWRQEFTARGMAQEEMETDRAVIEAWLGEPPLFSGKGWVPVFLWLVPLLAIASVAAASFRLINVTQAGMILLLPLVVSGIYVKRVNALHSRLGKKAGVLMKYARLFRHISERKFESELLKEGHALAAGAQTALYRLSRILESLDSRLNLLAGLILNAILAWDIRQVYRLERWKETNASRVQTWFGVLFDVDALISLANFAYNNPEGVFPVPSADGPLISAADAGHPIIPIRQRVDNPVGIGEWGRFLVVTGANMAGKSTYLRTTGTNLVLAMAGSAVIAREFRFRPMRLVASIRTRDSLRSNESYFYAELKKLRFIIGELEKGPCFILLDEILKGTNSRDKQTGSRALVEQLVRLGASGIIATHDLSLGGLSDVMPGRIENHCFEVQIDGDRLFFDYTLHDGVAQNLNASFLMRKMGITL